MLIKKYLELRKYPSIKNRDKTEFVYTGGIEGLDILNGTLFTEDGENRAIIGMIKVRSEFRNQGVGKKIVRELEKWLKLNGVKKVYIRSVREARVFWRLQGYKGDKTVGRLTYMDKYINPFNEVI